MRLGCKTCTAISRWGRGRCERHPDDRLKKRTGFGSHPGGRKAKPDAVGMQDVHGDFSLGSREMRAASRRAVEKADRVWFAPWRAKSQARMRLGCKTCTAISRWGRGRCERHPDGRLKKPTVFGSHPGEPQTQARCGWDVSSASTFRRHVQLLKPQDTATIQKEMAWSVSPFR